MNDFAFNEDPSTFTSIPLQPDDILCWSESEQVFKPAQLPPPPEIEQGPEGPPGKDLSLIHI